MFNNLIESSSHTSEFKRRGSFVLFTAVTYFLLFVIAGVMSIYAYDARLEDPNTEIVVMLNPIDIPAPPAPVAHRAPPPRGNASRPNTVVRQIAMASVNRPDIVPETTSNKPNPTLPVPDRGTFTIGDRDSGPVEVGGVGRSGSGGTGQVNGAGSPAIEVATPPLPVLTPTPKKIVTSSRVLNGLALSLPKPSYPPIARQIGLQGAVNVQVVIDETGKVISAKAVSGSPLLKNAAQQAALGARFSPTKLGDQAVKVSGLITYNFVLQR